MNQLLLNHDEAVAYFRRAIAIDPTHVDSRIECAAVLIEQGDPDAAIRELTEVLRLDATDDEAYSMLARAYWDKGAWGRAVEHADKAIELKPSNAQAHLWKADALRHMAAESTDRTVQISLYADARTNYRTFLDLTNFSTGLGSKLAFHFIGLGVGEPPSCRPAGRLRQPAQRRLPRAVPLRAEGRQPAEGPRLLQARAQPRAEGSDRLFPARQRQPRSLQLTTGLRLPGRRARELHQDAGNQSRTWTNRRTRGTTSARSMGSCRVAGAGHDRAHGGHRPGLVHGGRGRAGQRPQDRRDRR